LKLSLRDQGRLQEADTLIHQWRIPGTNLHLPSPGPAATDLALLATDMGHPALSIRTHRANAEHAARTNPMRAMRARYVVWNLALAGTAYAAIGDTAMLRRLADSLETIGSESNWERDVRMHHMLRGLLHQAAGRHQEAVDEFRRSLYSLTDGYTRTNLMLARSLLALGRGVEAIPVLQPAIRGGVDGSNTYVSRTELHEALAQAFEQAGQADSARVHYAMVERSWRRADPQFRERYQQARRKAGL
jgi:tetratricopeptide (TPR) repeat protein